jgi:TetR/AcrR family transcriptional regulator, cholesterol catabolism regulator
MQFQKENIKDNILAAARQEFWENGFEKASIRNITCAARTSKSNVYNYFSDKDALFAAVVEPTLSEIESGFEKLRAQNPETSAETYSMTAQENVITKIMEFVFRHDADLKLLLLRSSGSSIADFKSRVTEALADILEDWISHAAPSKGIPEFFIRTVAGFYIGAIEQMLAEGITKEQAAGHFDVFLKFVYGGWNTVFNKE